MLALPWSIQALARSLEVVDALNVVPVAVAVFYYCVYWVALKYACLKWVHCPCCCMSNIHRRKQVEIDRPVSGFFPTLGPQIILIKVYQHHIPDMDINVHMALYSSSINSFTLHSIHSPIYMIASIIQCRIKTIK